MWGDPRLHTFDELTGEPTDAFVQEDIAEDDYSVIFYTSGTTGRPKGAISTHRSMVANLQNTMFNAVAGSMSGTGGARSEERRVGKEWVSTCRSRWSPYH